MATVLEIKDGGCIEMCTQLPYKDESREGPVFLLSGNEWNIRFILPPSYGNPPWYEAYLILQNIRTGFKPFIIDFSVGFKNEENVSLAKGNARINSKSFRFWCMQQSALESKLPPDYITGNFIKFVLHFYFSKDPTLQLSSPSRDKCVQTRSYADVSKGSLAKDFSMLLDSGLYHDVEIKCKKLSIKAHKIVLCARSEVFRAMLQSDMLECRTGIVTIQDIDVSCLQDFVKYFYTDTLPELTFDKAMTLYEAGDKYAVRSLTTCCSEYLQDNLSQENACQCLALADAHCDKKLKDRVIAYILEAKLFLQDEFWSPFCERYPKIALDIYKLSHKNTLES